MIYYILGESGSFAQQLLLVRKAAKRLVFPPEEFLQIFQKVLRIFTMPKHQEIYKIPDLRKAIHLWKKSLDKY